MLDEEITPVPVVVVPSVETQIEQTEDELDLVAEQVGVLAIEDEERHDELMEGVSECRRRLATLSTSMTQVENPVLTQILNELAEIRVRLDHLKENQSSNTSQSSRPPSESIPMEPEPVELNQVESTVEHEPAERTPKRKKYRVI